ncbi:uncharacterized protein CC84DRAFT_165521 [Paraphaeosphaeria sporulosa]|uniref:Methyltransferase domain-containing protein n=1 Tax=Paraphaeosphaeria sporulosa TaxID=1460663 RepID=A0A177D0G6_9PLEO|nr:uncharacterized protein CC84DRAFT_165521 [Paraphaeosphaeria sporulosa]OAG12898.1 hypothetical protein CC84DRAFT_165521 [Paraphaeosphaeria sporulosa]
MPPAPPSFGSQEYWNMRFIANPVPFEWLEAPTALDPYIIDALKEIEAPNPQLLHIGCGTSLLSYHLRAHVEKPSQIHNLDYSDVAIKLGRKREAEIFEAGWSASGEEATSAKPDRNSLESDQEKLSTPATSTAANSPSSCMRWSSANLLDHSSLLRTCQASAYSIVVDKSTSDSIACSDDLYVPLPYHVVAASPQSMKTNVTESPEPLHPLHIMAVHLALVTKPGGRWISLSYSMNRYPFLQLPTPESANGSSQPMQTTASVSQAPQQGTAGDEAESNDEVSLDDDLDDIPVKVLKDGFPDPSTLWKLVGKYDIEPQTASEATKGNETTHRPKVSHWIYVLERTNVPLYIRT